MKRDLTDHEIQSMMLGGPDNLQASIMVRMLEERGYTLDADKVAAISDDV